MLGFPEHSPHRTYAHNQDSWDVTVAWELLEKLEGCWCVKHAQIVIYVLSFHSRFRVRMKGCLRRMSTILQHCNYLLISTRIVKKNLESFLSFDQEFKEWSLQSPSRERLAEGLPCITRWKYRLQIVWNFCGTSIWLESVEISAPASSWPFSDGISLLLCTLTRKAPRWASKTGWACYAMGAGTNKQFGKLYKRDSQKLS